MSLKILQWNVGTLFYRRRREESQRFPYSLFHQHRIQFIERTIARLEPDVLCLQEYLPGEIDLSVYTHLAEVTTEHYPVFQTTIFSKVPLSSIHKDEKGAFVAAKINDLTLTSVHLDTWRSAYRAQQVERLLSFSKEHAACFVMGDFNFYRVANHFLKRHDVVSHQKLSDSFRYRSKGLLGSFVLPQELDYFYHAPENKVVSLKTHRPFSGSLMSAMDHYPTLIVTETEN